MSACTRADLTDQLCIGDRKPTWQRLLQRGEQLETHVIAGGACIKSYVRKRCSVTQDQYTSLKTQGLLSAYRHIQLSNHRGLQALEPI